MQVCNSSLSEEKLALLPTEEEVAFYREHGWYISKKVLSDEVIDEAIQGSERFYRGERDTPLSKDSGYSNWKPEDGYDVMRNNEFVSLQSRAIRQLALQPIIGAIAARLAKSKQIRLLDDQLIYKPPQDKSGKSAVGWHADRAYWATCSSDNLLTAWIPFHDCDVSRGSLVVLDGSHKWSNLQNTRFFNNPNLGDVEQQFQREGRQIVRVPMTLKKGQVSFHHCWTIHGSYSNRSQWFRLSLAVHLQDGTNHYRPFWNKKGEQIHIFDELLCRTLPNGDPDFSDPAIFPILWSEPEK
ncbi:phytanoyl-CoA dioxygenase [Chroococcidiopsis sp. CCALA 051]|uniref:phytanoyl-CoA dioxygenase family protein n=1 Tax=Chroococcidiopsis sp. CCALA 051 TaxID=869949 RepID=UPI000D0D786C|nr:phytanoyl-CoA dioxygenase family protein [Chroococcidiopsis sp. CCALA 051]MBE9015938.1 phytanoyl-CoA dioxygenase family protein [Chroococcidiopsidales cyanobacterium LEGE 13417]PSM48510.1 phytanoyl-CoA dioxygenase [Chroococcidiopsis sp. CCALA 051]